MTPVQTQILRETKGRWPSIFESISAEKHYEGKPCNRCAGVLRYRSTKACIACCRKQIYQYYLDNRESRRQAVNDYRSKNPDTNRRAHLKRAYGMTIAEFDALFSSQNRQCAACQSDVPNSKNWGVDHCHVSGNVRGILCGNCNSLLGHAKDDIARLEACIAYLRKHGVR